MYESSRRALALGSQKINNRMYESSRRALAPGSQKIMNRGYRQDRLDKPNPTQSNRGYRQDRLDNRRSLLGLPASL